MGSFFFGGWFVFEDGGIEVVEERGFEGVVEIIAFGRVDIEGA